MQINLDQLIEGAAENYARKHDISTRRAEEMLQAILERVWDELEGTTFKLDALANDSDSTRTDFSPYFVDPSDGLLEDLDHEIGHPEVGAGRWVFTTEDPKILAWIIAPYGPEWSSQMSDLRGKANTFLWRKRAGHNSWEDVSPFMKGDVQVEPPADNEAMARVRVLSRPSRLHFMYALSRLTLGDIWNERGGNVLSDLTTYKMRENRLDASETAPELLSTGLFEYSTSREAYMHFLLKDDLIAGCEKTGTEYAKLRRKTEILDALQSNAPGYLASVMEEKGVVTLSSEYEDELIELNRYVEKLVKPCQLLWFA